MSRDPSNPPSGRSSPADAHDDARAREARAILERVRQETEPQVGAGAERIVRRGGGHFLAEDVDASDRVEVWGTRIGRLGGAVAFVVLAVWLAQSLFPG